jgi:hypothetical protein
VGGFNLRIAESPCKPREEPDELVWLRLRYLKDPLGQVKIDRKLLKILIPCIFSP